MDFQSRLHALLPSEGGLHLWVEKVDGRVVVTDSAVLGEEDLPAELLRLVQARPLRQRGSVWLATPKGKLKRVPVPAVAYTPEQSLKVLHEISQWAQKARDNSAPREDQPGVANPNALGPEVYFLLDLYRCAFDIVRAGRVMLRMDPVDNE